MRKTLLTVPVLAALLAGCSSSGKPAQTLAPATPSSSGPSSASTSTPASLAAELITVDALPVGWTTTSSSSGGNAVPSCRPLNSGAWLHLPGQAEADFQQSDAGPFLTEKLGAGSSTQVSQAWNAFASATSQCRTFTASSSSGTADYTLQQLSFPAYGDQTFAFGITVSTSGVTASGDVVVVRVGNTLVQIIAIGLPSVPVGTVEQATAAAVAKAK